MIEKTVSVYSLTKSEVFISNAKLFHGWDDVSVRMFKICDESLVKPLFNVFQFQLETRNFPGNWKTSNIVLVHKKCSEDTINNCRPVSLPPIFSKISEKYIYDTLYNYFECNDLFSKSQSGFRKGDSCVSQLLSKTLKIFNGFFILILRQTLVKTFWTFPRFFIGFSMCH